MTESPTPWDLATKTITNLTPILNEDGLVKRWEFFFEASIGDFEYKLKAGLLADSTKTPEEYSETELSNQYFLEAKTVKSHLKMKYDQYLSKIS
jgi:hypothetical protein